MSTVACEGQGPGRFSTLGTGTGRWRRQLCVNGHQRKGLPGLTWAPRGPQEPVCCKAPDRLPKKERGDSPEVRRLALSTPTWGPRALGPGRTVGDSRPRTPRPEQTLPTLLLGWWQGVGPCSQAPQVTWVGDSWLQGADRRWSGPGGAGPALANRRFTTRTRRGCLGGSFHPAACHRRGPVSERQRRGGRHVHGCVGQRAELADSSVLCAWGRGGGTGGSSYALEEAVSDCGGRWPA